MTAEIAVLNKSAVALAADSVVTISREGNQKAYNVNKLFTLSKYRPVGVMVFSNAELMGVPWETIIKIYRKQLGKKAFDTVEEYAKDFIRFIGSNKTLFPKKRQDAFFPQQVIAAAASIRNEATRRIKKLALNGGGTVTEKQIRDSTAQAIKDRLNWIKNAKRVGTSSDSFVKRLATTYARQIDAVINKIFPNKQLSVLSKRQLSELVCEAIARGKCPFGKTGVVVAGFGESQIFPEVYTFFAHTVCFGQLVTEFEEDSSFSPAESDNGVLMEYAAVLPFAQTDVVNTFLSGVDPEFLDLVRQQIHGILESYPNFVAEKSGIVSPQKQSALKNSLKEYNREAMVHIDNSFKEMIDKNHKNPLNEIVSVLPKDELANIASALVELTSVKRKMSPGRETVGGPIDVAVISKGDGFVWISRKHYFKPEFNPNFASNYFGERGNENAK